jgi:hypothetical protein
MKPKLKSVQRVVHEIPEDKNRSTRRRVTYQFEFVKCGKPSCRCADPRSRHGPYWFAYWQHVGVRQKRYVGVTLKFLSFEQLRATERSDKRKASRARKQKNHEAETRDHPTERRDDLPIPPSSNA